MDFKNKFLSVLLHTVEVAVAFIAAYALVELFDVPMSDELLGFLFTALFKLSRVEGADYVNKLR